MDRILARTAGLVAVAVLPLTLLSCSDTSQSVSPELDVPGPSRQITDAAHGGGNAHFYWLPPMVGDPGPFENAFNGAQKPTIRICDLSDCAGSEVAVFTMLSDPGSETIRVDREAQHYIVNWHTDQFEVGSDATYRIEAIVLGETLGIADVQFAASGSEAKNLTTGEVIGLVDGRTLPIKFRIERGAAAEKFVVAPGSGATVTSSDGNTTLAVPPDALSEETELTVEPVDAEGGALTAVDFGPDGTTFSEPVPVTIGYDPAGLPAGLAETDLALNLLHEGRWIVLPGSVVDPVTHTVTAPFHHFSTGGAGPAELAVFCPGDGDPATFDVLSEAVAAVMDGGTVEVCDGTYTVQDEVIDRPITLEGAAGVRPTLTTAGAQFGILASVPAGTLTLRNLRLETHWSSDIAGSALMIGFTAAYDQVVIEDVDLHVTQGSFGVGAWLFSSETAGGHVTMRNVTGTSGVIGLYILTTNTATRGASVRVEDSSFSNPGGNAIRVLDVPSDPSVHSDVAFDNITVTAGLGVFAVRSDPGVGPRVDITNSAFSGGAIWYQSGASGLIQNNTLDCGHGSACIRVRSDGSRTAPEPVRIIGNQLSGNTRDALWLTQLDAGPFEVRDNQLNGGWFGGDRTDPFSYSFKGTGIRVQGPEANGILTGNVISGAYRGIVVEGGTAGISAQDNTISTVWSGVTAVSGGQLSVHSSDITDYLVPLDTDGSFATGDLTCNWWGSVAGPTGVDPGIATDVFTPWALASVAGTSTTSCSGS